MNFYEALAAIPPPAAPSKENYLDSFMSSYSFQSASGRIDIKICYNVLLFFLGGGGGSLHEIFILFSLIACWYSCLLTCLSFSLISFQVLKTILNSIQGTKGTKRTPHHIAPELASDIRKHLSTSLRHHKSGLPCVYFQEMSTFVIPQGRYLIIVFRDICVHISCGRNFAMFVYRAFHFQFFKTC